MAMRGSRRSRCGWRSSVSEAPAGSRTSARSAPPDHHQAAVGADVGPGSGPTARPVQGKGQHLVAGAGHDAVPGDDDGPRRAREPAAPASARGWRRRRSRGCSPRAPRVRSDSWWAPAPGPRVLRPRRSSGDLRPGRRARSACSSRRPPPARPPRSAGVTRTSPDTRVRQRTAPVARSTPTTSPSSPATATLVGRRPDRLGPHDLAGRQRPAPDPAAVVTDDRTGGGGDHRHVAERGQREDLAARMRPPSGSPLACRVGRRRSAVGHDVGHGRGGLQHQAGPEGHRRQGRRRAGHRTLAEVGIDRDHLVRGRSPPGRRPGVRRRRSCRGRADPAARRRFQLCRQSGRRWCPPSRRSRGPGRRDTRFGPASASARLSSTE